MKKIRSRIRNRYPTGYNSPLDRRYVDMFALTGKNEAIALRVTSTDNEAQVRRKNILSTYGQEAPVGVVAP